MNHYFTLIIPWEPTRALRTEWHPTTPEGHFSTLSRGALESETDAHAWADTHIPGTTYAVRPCEGYDDSVEACEA